MTSDDKRITIVSGFLPPILKNIHKSNWSEFPQEVGVKTKNDWNHHLDKMCSFYNPQVPTSIMIHDIYLGISGNNCPLPYVTMAPQRLCVPMTHWPRMREWLSITWTPIEPPATGGKKQLDSPLSTPLSVKKHLWILSNHVVVGYIFPEFQLWTSGKNPKHGNIICQTKSKTSCCSWFMK